MVDVDAVVKMDVLVVLLMAVGFQVIQYVLRESSALEIFPSLCQRYGQENQEPKRARALNHRIQPWNARAEGRG